MKYLQGRTTAFSVETLTKPSRALERAITIKDFP